MFNKNCELCNGTGWYGDNGPGIRGNGEYVPCEYCNPNGTEFATSMKKNKHDESDCVFVSYMCGFERGKDHMKDILLDALKGLYEHTKNNYNIAGLNQKAKEAIEKATGEKI